MIFIAQCLPCSINDHESCTELLLEHMESGEQLLNSPDDNGRYCTHMHTQHAKVLEGDDVVVTVVCIHSCWQFQGGPHAPPLLPPGLQFMQLPSMTTWSVCSSC